jgi:RNA polymerase sigma-70 factor (ECF subfamily)
MMRTLAHLDDLECAARARGGDGKAFAALVTRHQGRIYRFLLRLLHSPDDALELTQDTFLHAYQGMAGWRPEATFKTWLFRIARNLAFDRLRRDKLVSFVELDEGTDPPDPSAGPEALAETAERLRLLEGALQRLAAEHREVLLLREIEDLSYDEIAAVLNLNAGTVKSRIARARAALLAQLSPMTEVAR